MEADPPAYYILQSQGNVYPCVETPQGKTKVFCRTITQDCVCVLYTMSLVCAGIFEQSMGARIRVRIGLSYRPARLHRLAESISGLHNSFKIGALFPSVCTVHSMNKSYKNISVYTIQAKGRSQAAYKCSKDMSRHDAPNKLS
jgi:hypothetical protein